MRNIPPVFFSEKKHRREAETLARLAEKLPKLAGKPAAYFETFLISDREMRILNRRFRKKNKTTNVLSFGAGKGSLRPDLGRGKIFLGEVFLAPDCIRARKEKTGFLLIHGFLHLLGYTHKRKNDRMRMERLEKEFSGKSGI